MYLMYIAVLLFVHLQLNYLELMNEWKAGFQNNCDFPFEQVSLLASTFS